MKLISMVDYILSLKGEKDQVKKLRKIDRYAAFLKEPLRLAMFEVYGGDDSRALFKDSLDIDKPLLDYMKGNECSIEDLIRYRSVEFTDYGIKFLGLCG